MPDTRFATLTTKTFIEGVRHPLRYTVSRRFIEGARHPLRYTVFWRFIEGVRHPLRYTVMVVIFGRPAGNAAVGGIAGLLEQFGHQHTPLKRRVLIPSIGYISEGPKVSKLPKMPKSGLKHYLNYGK